MISEWEKHTLLADTALQLDDPVRSILHYQQALSLSEDISECVEIEADERLLISVISCHNLAQFWRWAGDTEYELKYLQLASEKVLTLIPQCPNREGKLPGLPLIKCLYYKFRQSYQSNILTSKVFRPV